MIRPAVLTTFALAFLCLSGCGGDLTGESRGRSNIEITGGTDYNGSTSSFRDDDDREITESANRFVADGSGREFTLRLRSGTLSAEQIFDLDEDEATSRYSEGSNKVWKAVGGSARVILAIGVSYEIRLRTIVMEPDPDVSGNEATGTVTIGGRLFR